MKKVAILLFGLFALTQINAQIYKTDITTYSVDYKLFDISKISDDTIYWFKVKGRIPIDVTVTFTDFSDDDSVLDFYRGSIKGDSIYYNALNGSVGTTLPVTLVKATYIHYGDVDTISSVGIQANYWTGDLLGVYLDKNSSTSGNMTVTIDR